MAQSANNGRDWALFFAGILVVLAGIIIFFLPGDALVSIAIIAGVMLLVGAVFDIVSYVRFRGTGFTSGWAIVNAIFSAILGIMFLANPIISAGVIPMMAGIFVLCYGVMAIAAGITLRNAGPGWGVMILNGVVSLLCGIMFIVMPASFAIFLAVFLIMRGVTMCVFGLTSSEEEQELLI